MATVLKLVKGISAIGPHTKRSKSFSMNWLVPNRQARKDRKKDHPRCQTTSTEWCVFNRFRTQKSRICVDWRVPSPQPLEASIGIAVLLSASDGCQRPSLTSKGSSQSFPASHFDLRVNLGICTWICISCTGYQGRVYYFIVRWPPTTL